MQPIHIYLLSALILATAHLHHAATKQLNRETIRLAKAEKAALTKLVKQLHILSLQKPSVTLKTTIKRTEKGFDIDLFLLPEDNQLVSRL